MSYVISIKCLGGKPITASELREAIEHDPTLREMADEVETEPGVLSLEWVEEPGETPKVLTLYGGEIDVTSPSDSTLQKMQELAGRLGARVIGEEGEDLTDIHSSEFSAQTDQSGSGCLVIIFVIAGIIMWHL